MHRVAIRCGSSITLVTSIRDKNPKDARFSVAACNNSFYSIATTKNKQMLGYGPQKHPHRVVSRNNI